MRRILPNFESLTEFGRYNGDCGEDATLFALHAMSPAAWPLAVATLDALTATEIAEGYAAANGAQNIPSMDTYLTALGVPHVTRGYNQFSFAELHTDLQQLAGVHPIIIEFSQAGDGLPQDERLVKFHYATIGGIDDAMPIPSQPGVTGGYLRADGDASTNNGQAPSAPIPTSWQQLVSAVPIAYIIVTGVPSNPNAGAGPVVPAGWHDDGTTLTAPNGVPVTQGFRDHVLAGWASDDYPLAAVEDRNPLETSNPALGAGTRQVFRRTVLEWTPARGVFVAWGGQELLHVEAELSTAQSDVSADAATIQALQASESTLQQEVSAAAAEEQGESANGEPAGTIRLHVVQGGELLTDISTRYYGDSSHADAIQAANHLPTDNLSSGMALVIP